ncbi:Ferric/cupric reductase transmembrane component 1 [Cytospora mali]|uniref:Ferric/cupric reductase transmembrane component 1 n=1 Tax=Cytospora mali TaxID=578113 RepID=A0A194UR58_CYTMA|nr:Ferric/cupric reductase transmembrane component 1 [Valsa mali var. pyri (nom. inval.)]
MATRETIIAGRMIQNFTDANASELQPHWGYANRLMPCTSDAGSCAYLDVVYHSHDLSMLYTGIFWSAIGGILFLWGIGRRLFPSVTADDILISTAGKAESQGHGRTIGGVEKLKRTVASLGTRYLLPEFAPRILGHVTRLQVLVMLVLAGYLTIFSFVGIVYNTWVTPVSSSPGSYNIRTSLGPFADRIGVLAYALTPLSVLLSSRESLLSLVTGIPYQSFMFLHRWVGYIILIQSSVHTLGWVIVEARLYQPQPSSWNAVAGELYIQLTGYEFFRKAHYVLAMVYIGAIIGHWQNLQCFLIPGILLWFFDRLGRWIRTGLLHYQWVPSKGRWGFETAKARVTYWDDEETGNVVRLDFDHVQQPWELGQHFYLCFTESSIWQSHPMTPLSLPVADKSGRVRHSYVIRAKKGETKKLAEIAAKKMAAAGEKDSEVTTSVVLTGPYGVDMVSDLTPDMNVLCVAGGTGITFVLPVLLRLMREKRVPGRKARLVWAVRRDVDVKWVEQELEEIKEVGCSQGIKVDVFVTREKSHHHVRTVKTGEDSKAVASASSSASSSGEGCDCNDVTHHHASNIDVPEERRPHLEDVVKDFVGSVERGSTTVYASGPGGMIGDLRRAVAGCNEAGRVWKGEGRGDVRLICDDRLE